MENEEIKQEQSTTKKTKILNKIGIKMPAKKATKQSKKERKLDLVVAIVKRGFADYVIDAARDKGATGGTIINGRGTAGNLPSFLGVQIQPEKEVVLIVVKSEIKSAVMTEIIERTTLDKNFNGICFSLPVNSIVGATRIIL